MNILLPIETINREIDFKLALSALLANGNEKIFIGQHNFLNALLPQFSNGLYVGKNVFYNFSEWENGEFYEKYKNKDFNIVYLHEEGAVFKREEENWKTTLSRQYNTDFFKKEDVICDWGNFQRKYDESRSQNINIQTTGHPRFDLYKKKWRKYFQEEIDELKNKYGDFVLINGNYGYYNHGIGLDYILSKRAGYIPQDNIDRLDRISFMAYSGKQCLCMVELTHQLSVQYPHLNFIYRPHPSENQHFYETVFQGVSNIHVNHEGPVSSWILSAEAIIHDGCTTALEASLAGKPVINYKPFESKENDIWLPNQLGERCKNIEDVKTILDNLKDYSFDIENIESSQKVKDLLFNFGNDSFEALVSVIEEQIKSKKESKLVSPSEAQISKEYLKMKTKQNLYKLKSTKSKKAADYHQRKFYGFDKAYVENKFKILEEMLSKKLDYKFHNPYLIEVK